MSAKEIKLRSFSLLPSFPSCCEPMTFVRQASAAVALITLSLWLQCGGMAALIGWARTSLGPDTHKLGPLRSAVLMVRFTTAIIALHVLQIFTVGNLLSLDLSAVMGICFLLLDGQLYDCRLWRCGSSPDVANLRSGGKCRRRLDVRAVRKLPVCHGDQACRGRGTVLTSARESTYRA